MPEDGQIQSISIYQGGSDDLLLAVYSDANGLPDQRLALTEETEIHSYAGWQTVQLTNPIDVNEGQTIWLAWVFENNPGIRYKWDINGRATSTQTWSSGMPDDFGSSTTNTAIYSIYANYTPDQQDQQPELIGNPYMFTGRRFDLETGLYYYRARYYNPYIGRFLQTDPAGQGMNMYTYCRNNPVRYIDTTGMYFSDYIDAMLNDPDVNWDDTISAILSRWVSPSVPLSWRIAAGYHFLNNGKPSYPVAPGQKWTINDFFNWYRYGKGDTVDLGNIGLLDDFQAHDAVRSNISRAQYDAINIAMEMATDLKQQWLEFYAMSPEEQGAAGSPPSWLNKKYPVSFKYNFAPHPVISTFNDSTLLVFGDGTLTADVTIGVGWTGLFGGAAWGVYINWKIDDPFKDPESNGIEWEFCTPYDMIGSWIFYYGGFI